MGKNWSWLSFSSFFRKKKLEEEEAEVKRKATDAAYQARQAVKTPPRRLPTVMVRSPIDSASPGGDYPLGDLTPNTMEEATSGVTPGTLPSTPVTSFPGIPDTLPPGSAPLEAPMTPVTDDSPQKKMLGQKATPPPSPLLSELLKKGSLLPTSPRLVNESEMSGHLNSTGVLLEVGGVLPMIHGGEIQPTTSAVAASPAASGAPTLSRLLEAGPTQFTTPLPSFTTVASEPPVKLVPPPVESVSQATIVMMPALPTPSSAPAGSTPENVAPVSQPDPCVPCDAVGDPHTVTVSMDSSEISMIINSIKEECFRSGVAEAPGGSKAPSIDGKEDLDLAEKMDIAVSYTGEELDFETVGDIIAIIEDKVDDHPEVLDVAAVEAALSFCEENDDPQSLPGPWEHPIQQEREKPAPLPAPEMTVKQERLDFEETENKGIHDLVDIRESGVEIKMEPAEPEPGMSGAEIVAGVGPVSSMAPPELRSQDLDEEPRSSAGGEIGETDGSSGKDDEMPLSTVKTEASPESLLSPSHGSNPIEDPLEDPHKFEISDSLKEESGTIFGSQIKDAPGDEEEEDGVSEVASLEEPKEEDQGEGYLSEMDNEPPVSESDDGFSIHNATLQSHTLADSIPSSPASSQFSVCSEDQEAIQAQKIWKKAIMLVWRAAANHRPMDLSTIKKNIENGLIRSTAEFQRDIMLMFQNAVMYNSSDHDVYHMAVEMQRDVLEQIQVRCKWIWMNSGRSGPKNSELSNEYRSALSSWNSSLDLDLSNWRETENSDVEAEELEESIPERESSEFLVEDVESEEPQEEGEQGNSQNLLHFLSEGEAQQDSKEEDQGEGDTSDMDQQPRSGDYDDSTSAQDTTLVDILYNCPNSSQLSDLSQGDPIQDHFLFKKTLLQVWKMIASHRFSSPFLKPVSEKQAPGYKDVVKSLRAIYGTDELRNALHGSNDFAASEREIRFMFPEDKTGFYSPPPATAIRSLGESGPQASSAAAAVGWRTLRRREQSAHKCAANPGSPGARLL
ncbi:Bromodomain-containing protein 8 [Microtus ochrogaster]|uniref:Bromodomain-containing protein 8 n=1 Tax=Microtus ochrogaster TaxID=79684 RepID=A0A8J6G915_MICOH|nr:Bromodomain-containing protein 8 [Microtus ochrogaster]